VNVRVIAATNRNLRDMIAQGSFREDLFYRLNVIHIVVPPLRERREDIPLLAQQFLTQFASANRSPLSAIAPAAMKALYEYSWPGNVRELENVIERLVVTVQGPTIELDHLSSEIRVQGNVAFRPRRERRRTVADELYKRMIEQHESFWTTVYPLFMDREITRSNVREVIRRGLEEARGNYKIVARIFNMETRDYKRFLNFLRKHDCQIPFKEYR
jgi:DNA-binding NtrC family response regulator